MASLGNTSVSSLLSSAASAANQLESLNISEADQTWEYSAKTATDYQQYQDTLNSYLNKYQGSQSTSDQSKAVSLQGKLDSASDAYGSAQIKRAQISIDQGTGSQADKVQLLANLYSTATNASDQQSILEQYDSAVKTMNDEATASASAASSSQSKVYSLANTNAATLKAQLASSILTGVNHIDPKLLNGSQTVYVNNKTGAQIVPMSGQTVPVGYTSETMTIPAQGAKMSVAQYVQLYKYTEEMKVNLYSTASQDSILTPQEQATYSDELANQQNSMAKDPLTNANNNELESMGYKEFVVKYVNGIPSVVANPNVDPVTHLPLNNPTQASIQKSLQAGNGDKSNVVMTFNGAPTLVTVGHAIQGDLKSPLIANPTDSPTGQWFSYNQDTGAMTPFSAQHQQAITSAVANRQDVGQLITNWQSQGQLGGQAGQTSQQKLDSTAKVASVQGVQNIANNVVHIVAKDTQNHPVDVASIATSIATGNPLPAVATLATHAIASAVAKPAEGLLKDVTGFIDGASAKRANVTAAQQALATVKINAATGTHLSAPLPAPAAPAPAPSPGTPPPITPSRIVPGQTTQQVARTVGNINQAIGGVGHI